MIASGDRLDLSPVKKPTVDKHSTGGVGDKVSLILAPLVAACGAAVPQLSGRGLGHTGGTLDKLEAVPGWRAALSNDEIRRQHEEVGAVVCAAGAGLAPVDRRLYALRDVTGTVESIPLIASSIMSKKIAEGTGALVLDVKVGRGAFMKDRARARVLASTMVGLGVSHGVRTRAQLSAMDAPLGRAAGNALEVTEAVEVLRGAGPADVRELTLALARLMVELTGLRADPQLALDDGSAYEVYRAMIAAQGGDPDAEMPLATLREVVRAPRAGVVESIDAYGVGGCAWAAPSRPASPSSSCTPTTTRTSRAVATRSGASWTSATAPSRARPCCSTSWGTPEPSPVALAHVRPRPHARGDPRRTQGPAPRPPRRRAARRDGARARRRDRLPGTAHDGPRRPAPLVHRRHAGQ